MKLPSSSKSLGKFAVFFHKVIFHNLCNSMHIYVHPKNIKHCKTHADQLSGTEKPVTSVYFHTAVVCLCLLVGQPAVRWRARNMLLTDDFVRQNPRLCHFCLRAASFALSIYVGWLLLCYLAFILCICDYLYCMRSCVQVEQCTDWNK